VASKKKGLSPTGSDIDKSITSLIDQIKRDVPHFADQEELKRLLRARFSSDVHKTGKFIQAWKNVSYATTLGNFWSAATQIGDLVFAFHKFGIKNAVAAIFGPSITNRAELGIEKAMAEFNSSTRGITSVLADKAFKWSGFDAIDRFGKNVNINAALRLNRKLAIKNPDKFVKKYGEKFGDETQSLIHELQHMKMVKNNPDLSDNMYLMLWNELSDTQPIGLSEMPFHYLNMPNGRIAYAYKTFAMKQLNYMRNIITAEKNPFVKASNLTYFATMFVLANGTIDQFKDFMAGKDLDFESKLYDNLLSLPGTSKYAVDKSIGLGGIIQHAIAPVPVTQAVKALDNITGGKSPMENLSEAANQLPVVGKLKKNWLDD